MLTETKLKWQREYRSRPEIKARDNANKRESLRKKRLLVLQHYSYDNGKTSCIICGDEDINHLCLDHANGDGAKWRKIHGTGSNIYNWLISNNFPKEPALQTLCNNCNNGKANGRLSW